ncbi:hypothetical protein [Arthrobacter sp. KK5.5]|uniref:hypothetical protein n=1 Tax=Arthrobacter sp. KK5.5 TaxID=3373084 RepID=UPI003EE5CC6A
MNPQERGSLDEDRSDWYRYDTPGRTVYMAVDAETAFVEALSWARMTHRHRAFLAKTAEFMGIAVADLRRVVEEEWSANSGMVPGGFRRIGARAADCMNWNSREDGGSISPTPTRWPR